MSKIIETFDNLSTKRITSLIDEFAWEYGEEEVTDVRGELNDVLDCLRAAVAEMKALAKEVSRLEGELEEATTSGPERKKTKN